MPDHRRSRCQRCTKSREEADGITWSGLCVDCAKAAVDENIEGLMTMSGEPLQRWRRGMAASVGALLLDDLPAKP